MAVTKTKTKTKIKAVPGKSFEELRRDFPDVMGVFEVGEALDVNVTNLHFIKDLPEPVTEVRATRLWLADEIRVFAKVYKMRRRARQAREAASAS